jgi:hypothetical protein
METSKSSGSIGVQLIQPRTGTAWQVQNSTPVQPANPDGGRGGASEPDRSATPDGVGGIVDKVV